MCGIAGIFHRETPKPVDPTRVERMCDAMVHRGPDGTGVWTGAGIGLGHRRLSIIDLAGSPQPMVSSDGRAVIVFNGEIYNFRELRAQLEREGATFQTCGDTEVILAAWQRWGPDCLSHLDGMFAFALYDSDKRQLFLARDRFGVKPLFLSELSDGSIIFASELKGLLTHPMMRRRLSPKAVEAYMAWGYVPDSHSILEGVTKLGAGHFLLLEQGKSMPQQRCWWDISFEERLSGKEGDLSAQLVHLLREAVQSRMVSDVPLGAFLSGGVDSSSVVALMSEASTKPVNTCSIGFDVEALDETSYAQTIAERFGTIHKARNVRHDDFGEIDQLAAMFDEPFADASALPTWRVCQLAREKVTVALSGDGADEAFAGYRRQVFHHNEGRVRSFLPQGLRQSLFGGLGRLWPKADWAPRPLRAKTTLLSLAQSAEQGYANALSVTAPQLRSRLFTSEFASRLAGFVAEDELIEMMRSAPARSDLDKAQYVDLKFWLPGDILTKVDRTSMSVSLEAREPLLDHRLVEFAAQLPESMRVRSGTGKYLLKQCMERYLPKEVLYRPKQGFVTPIAQWMRGPLAGEIRSIASRSILIQMGIIDPASVTSLADAHISGRSDHSRTLWQLLMLDKSLQTMGVQV